MHPSAQNRPFRISRQTHPSPDTPSIQPQASRTPLNYRSNLTLTGSWGRLGTGLTAGAPNGYHDFTEINLEGSPMPIQESPSPELHLLLRRQSRGLSDRKEQK